MAQKNLDAYKLGVILDAAGAKKGIDALAEADKRAMKLDGSLTKLAKGIKFGLAEKFKSELDDVGKLAGSSRASTVGKQLGGMIGGGIKDGIGSVFTASNLGKLIGSAVAPGVGTVVGGMIGSAVDTAIEKAAGPVKALIQQGLDLNEVLDRATVHFTDILGSRETALKHLDELNSIEGKSGIDMRELIAASQRLEEFNDNLSLTEVELKAAAYQSVVFGSGVEGFHSIANALGIIAEKGELTSRTLLKLEKQGVHATRYLSEGLGLSEQKVKQLIASNRLRGDVAARIIAEGVVAHKGASAENVINSTLYGQRMLFENNVEELAGRGTRNVSGAIRDSYALGNTLLSSSRAQQLVDFLDSASGSLIKMTQAAVKTGYGVTSGIVQGMLDPSGLTQGVTSYVGKFTDALTSPAGFDINSPSKKMIPVGESAGEGVVVGFENYMANEGGRRIAAAVDGVSVRARAEVLARDPRVRAMLDAIGFSEGTDKRFGYATHVGGRRSAAGAGQKDRSVVYLGRDKAGRPLRSSADGRYQFLNSTWDGDARSLGLTDFSPHSQDLAAVYELMKSGAINPLMSGDFGGAVHAARRVWASFPGAGYNQGERSLSSLQKVYDRSLAVGGFTVNNAPVSPSNPVPVVVAAGDLRGGTGLFVKEPRAADVAPLATVRATEDAVETLGQDVTAAHLSFVEFPKSAVPAGLAMSLIERETRRAAETTRGYSMSQEEYRKAALRGADALSKVAGAFGQMGGMVPGQQVGKKRGFFSKMLGFAAPFLSFIPGVGPILSQIAGIASSAVGGDYAGAINGAAAGFSSGGVFRRSGSAPTPALGDVSTSQGNVGTTVNRSPPARAMGGPVRKGRAYTVGDRGPRQYWEVFEPEEDGYVHASVDAYARRRAGADSGTASGPHFGQHGNSGIGAMLTRIEAHFARLDAVPMDHVFTSGARRNPGSVTDAFMRHGAQDQRVTEWMNRRVAA